MENKMIRVGITVGDVNSIGIEVIIKTLNDPLVYANSIPVIYGSSKTFSFHKKALNQNEFNYLVIKDSTEAKPKKINLINVWDEEINIVLGEKNANGGKYALKSLQAAVADLKSNRIDVLVTAPINKDCVREAGFEFPGHTEYLAHISEAKDVLMLMVAGDLKVGVVTGHVPLKDVPALITKERIDQKLRLLLSTLKKDFMISKPRIAVLGLNPHAGDRGTLGSEEIDTIIPVVQKFRDEGEIVFGPYSSDGFFGSSNLKNFDAILAMYHDQGLTGFKSISFDEGVNFTAGLPIVRTSPDHGTAYDIAGKDKASPTSFRNAYYLALDIYENRLNHKKLQEGALQKQVPVK